jgi:hypothetical protein
MISKQMDSKCCNNNEKFKRIIDRYLKRCLVLSLFLSFFLILPKVLFAHPLTGTNDYVENADTAYIDDNENWGSIDAGDWDFWVYSIPTSGILNIELRSGNPDFDCDWILFNEDASGSDPIATDILLMSQQTEPEGEENVYNINVSAGNYYLKIYSHDGSTGFYFFKSTFETPHPVAGTNDYKANAPTADIDGTANGLILGAGDWDYWKYEFPDSGYVDVELDSMFDVDCDWELQDTGGNVVSSSKTAEVGGSENKFNIDVNSGTYYLKVFLRDGSIGGGGYTFRSNFTPSQIETRIKDFDNVITNVGKPVKLSVHVEAKNFLGIFGNIEDGQTIYFYVDENLNGFDDEAAIGAAETSNGIASLWYMPTQEGTFPVKAVMPLRSNYDRSEAQANLTANIAKWTYMVYMAGDDMPDDPNDPDTGISNNAVRQFGDLISASNNQFVNIYVLLDTADSNTNGSDTRRYIAVPDINHESPDPEKWLGTAMWYGSSGNNPSPVEESTGTPGTLKNFIDWVYENSPSDYYCLNFWGHGNTWYGNSHDDKSDASDDDGLAEYMDIKEVGDLFNENNYSFDILAFRNCLMGSVEVLTELYPFTDYIVASEHTQFDKEGGIFANDSWDFNQILDSIDDSTTPFELGNIIVEKYDAMTNNCRKFGTNIFLYDTSYATINTLNIYIDNVADALSKIFLTYPAEREIIYELIQNSKRIPISLDEDCNITWSEYQLDLTNLLNDIINDSNAFSFNLKFKAQTLKDFISLNVILRWRQDVIDVLSYTSHGLSITFFENGDDIYTKRYIDGWAESLGLEFTRITNWDNFNLAFLDYWEFKFL